MLFAKMLVACRGMVAVRILRAGREMGIPTLALYTEGEQGALHVRLADESVLVEDPASFYSGPDLISLALERGARAIHPGDNPLAGDPAFARACQAAGITVISPQALAALENLLVSTGLERGTEGDETDRQAHLRALAVTAAVLYAHRSLNPHPTIPEQLWSGWHRRGRRVESWPYGGLIHDPPGD